jgi:hypothetical protein
VEISNNPAISLVELHPTVEWTLRPTTPEEKNRGGQNSKDYVLVFGGVDLLVDRSEALEFLKWHSEQES